jgi:site-specific recombinase XerD
MKTCSFHPDAGLHALRHTFLTEAGRHTQNVKALQQLAGHSRIATTQKYLHPGQDDMDGIVGAMQQKRASQSEVTTVFTTLAKTIGERLRKM